jgi:BirA family biotin operon repressor/biotin-[acetyl-CoA-carboxylase] ligase
LAELSEDEYVSGEAISNKLDITRPAVWKHIRKLREYGYDIRAEPRNGYIIAGRPDKLIAAELHNRLETSVIGSQVEYYEVIGSTADEARAMAAQGAPEGTVLTAESQTSGRGRMERGWVTPHGQAIALSVILYPDFPPMSVPLLGLATSLAAKRAIETVTGLEPELKWPNDIFLAGKKAGGVLLEMSAELDQVRWVTISVGINVNNRFTGSDLADVATSLRMEAGRMISRLELAIELLTGLDRIYQSGLTGTPGQRIVDDFAAADMLQGRNVTVRTPSGKLHGTVTGIDSDGRLLLSEKGGKVHSLFSGEATLADS